MNIKQIVVSCEKLLAKLEKEYPMMTKVSIAGGTAITSAGAGYALGQVAASAKKHDSDADNHTVHHKPH